MSDLGADFHDGLSLAMRALDAVERHVRSCRATARDRYDEERETVATSNLQVVLERRKELGDLWSKDIEEMKGDLQTAEIQRLLAPLGKLLEKPPMHRTFPD